MRLEGGCLCGRVRYAVEVRDGDPADVCHCGQCRRWTGAPAAAWVQVPPGRFALGRGQPRGFGSSGRGTRWFCPACGASLYMTDPDGRSVGVLLGSLDDPEAIAPRAHGWAGAALAWFVLDDGLPRHAEDPPYDSQQVDS